MNILIVTSMLPWPLDSGGHSSQYSTLKALSSDHSFRIILASYSTFSPESADMLEANIPSVKVIRPKVVKSSPFESNRTSLAARIKSRALATIRKMNLPALNVSDNAIQKHVSEVRIKRAYSPFSPLSEEVISYIYENCHWADIIQAEFHECLFAGFLPLPSTAKIFICHQAHNIYTKSYYEDLERSFHGESTSFNYIAEADTAYALNLECAVMNGFDHVVVFSENDKRTLAAKCSVPLSVSPFPLPSDVALVSPQETFLEPTRLVFLGPGNWHPNVDALNWLYANVITTLPLNPTFTFPILHVIGNWDERLASIYDPKLVCFHGYAEELSSCLQGSISVNPVFTGAGLRTKLLAAAASSSPIISTTHGAEGTGLVHRQHCLIADTPDDFVNAVISLLTDSSFAYKLAISAFNHVRANFSDEAVRLRRNMIYQSVRSANP